MKNNISREKLLDVAFTEVYRHGYHGAATAKILKESGVPKGSMYHHFDSKKALVLAVITERILPKMLQFFSFQRNDGECAIHVMQRTFQAMASNDNLIKFGCPLYRLMVEMASLDDDFNTLLNNGYKDFVARLKRLLDEDIKRDYLIPFNTLDFAQFVITASWGRLSLSPELSSKEDFLIHFNFILHYLNQYKTSN